jgi:hypothetical protein
VDTGLVGARKYCWSAAHLVAMDFTGSRLHRYTWRLSGRVRQPGAGLSQRTRIFLHLPYTKIMRPE